eukprot:s6853_g2.t1
MGLRNGKPNKRFDLTSIGIPDSRNGAFCGLRLGMHPRSKEAKRYSRIFDSAENFVYYAVRDQQWTDHSKSPCEECKCLMIVVAGNDWSDFYRGSITAHSISRDTASRMRDNLLRWKQYSSTIEECVFVMLNIDMLTATYDNAEATNASENAYSIVDANTQLLREVFANEPSIFFLEDKLTEFEEKDVSDDRFHLGHGCGPLLCKKLVEWYEKSRQSWNPATGIYDKSLPVAAASATASGVKDLACETTLAKLREARPAHPNRRRSTPQSGPMLMRHFDPPRKRGTARL